MAKCMYRIAVLILLTIILACNSSNSSLGKDNNLVELITQLGSSSWEEREISQNKLIEHGENLINQYSKSKNVNKEQSHSIIDEISKLAEALYQGYQNSDAEIKYRTTHILRHFYNLTSSQIVFTSNRDGNYEIYRMDIDGKKLRNLTHNKQRNFDPHWSPNGQKIVFMSYYPKYVICVMDADGKNQICVTNNKIGDDSPSWDPDGKKILYRSMVVTNLDIYKDIYIMDADGANQERLTQTKLDENKATFNPKGDKIAFISGWILYVMDINGRTKGNLIQEEIIGCGTVVWSPDGENIAFGSHRDGPGSLSEIYTYNFSTKKLQRLTENRADDDSPEWSPDGKAIAFTSERDGNFEIYIMDSDGKNQRRLTQHPLKLNNWNPVWSPDGKKIAFESQWDKNSKSYNICIMDADGKNLQNLTQNNGNNDSPCWYPIPLDEIAVLFTPAEPTQKEIPDKSKDEKPH